MNSIDSHVGVKKGAFQWGKKKKRRKESQPLETEQPGEQCPGGTEELCSGPSFELVGKQKEQLQLSGDRPVHHLLHKSFKSHPCQTCILFPSSPEAVQDLTLEFPRQGSSCVLLQGMPKALSLDRTKALCLCHTPKPRQDPRTQCSPQRELVRQMLSSSLV